MSLRQLVEGDCGGVNPLMQLGGQFTRDVARKDEGFSRAQFERGIRPEEQMVNDFLGQIAAPPQSFQMETLLQEMREIEHSNATHTQMINAPRVIDEVTRAHSNEWAKEFHGSGAQQQHRVPLPMGNMVNVHPQQQQLTHVSEFFDEHPGFLTPHMNQGQFFARPAPHMEICRLPYQPPMIDQFFEEHNANLALENHVSKV